MLRVDRLAVRHSWANVVASTTATTVQLEKTPLAGNGFLGAEKDSNLFSIPHGSEASDFSTLNAQIAYHLSEVRRLQQQQRDKLRAMIRLLVPPGCIFSARELWTHRLVSAELTTAFDDAGIRNARQLGKRRRALGLARVGVEHGVTLWTCE